MKIFLVSVAILFVSKVQSQSQWNGSQNSTDSLTRLGFVGIGTTTLHPYLMLQVGNSLGFNSQAAQQEINFNAINENGQGLWRRPVPGM